MTDGADESAGNSQDSQGSMDEFIQQILDEHDAQGEGFWNDALNGICPPGPSTDTQNTSTMGLEMVETPVPHSAVQSWLQIKHELQAEEISPDSGYTQVPSNESHRSSPCDISNQELPPSAAHRQLYEIDPQPIIPNPARSNCPGDYGFKITFEKRDAVPKNINHTHSYLLDKLYVKMNVPCPIQFHCHRRPPPGAIIRAMLVFSLEEQVHETVRRCPSHFAMDKSRPDLAEHVVQTFVPGNTVDQSYYHSSNDRFSVVVPFPTQSEGEVSGIVLYKFMCWSSCAGGMNRRSVLAVFTLEDRHGMVLGRACVEVKVCTCPGRDRPNDEDRRRKRNSAVHVAVPLPKKRCKVVDTPNSTSGYRLLRVRVENYEILSILNDALNLSRMVSDEQRAHYQQEQHKDE